MDLLTIIQERINAKLTKTICSVDQSTGRAPADTHDASKIEATGTVIETASCTTGNDTYDVFFETVLTGACNPPSPAIKNESVMPGSNQPPNHRTQGTVQDTMEVHIPQGAPATQQKGPAEKTKQKKESAEKAKRHHPQNQSSIDFGLSDLLPGIAQYPS